MFNFTVELLNLEVEVKTGEIEQAQKARDEQVRRAEVAEQLFEISDQDVTAAKNEIEALRAQNANLFDALKRLRKGTADIRIPEGYAALPGWVDEYFADRVLLLPRAKRGLKGAVFGDEGLVYRCIQTLAEEYWRLRTAPTDEYESAKRTYAEKSKSLGVDEEAAIAPTRLGEHREQYTVDYTVGQSSRQVLSRHLRGGSSTKEDRYCLRIYFFWDDERQKVVIGHLPSHLDTRAT